MTWVMLDDDFCDHPKVLRLYDGDHAADAIALWARAASWSGRQLTEGAIPRGFVRQSPHVAGAAELVRVGLWLETPAGYQFNGWLDRNPTKDQVLATRLRNAERQANYRARHRVSNSVTDVTVTMPRPDPVPDPDLRSHTPRLIRAPAHEEQSACRIGNDFMLAVNASLTWDFGSWKRELELIGDKPESQRTVALTTIQASRWCQTSAHMVTPGHVVKYWPKYASGKEALTQVVASRMTEIPTAAEYAAAEGQRPWEK